MVGYPGNKRYKDTNPLVGFSTVKWVQGVRPEEHAHHVLFAGTKYPDWFVSDIV